MNKARAIEITQELIEIEEALNVLRKYTVVHSSLEDRLLFLDNRIELARFCELNGFNYCLGRLQDLKSLLSQLTEVE